MKKQLSPDQLTKKLYFYRVLSSLMAITIVFIGMNNISTTDAANAYKHNAEIEKAKREVIEQEFNDALCLPRISEMDKKLKLK